MIQRPVFSPQYQVDVKQDSLLISYEGNFTVIQSPICYALAPYLNGAYTSEQIVYALGEQFAAEELYYTLLLLEQDGYITDARDDHHLHAFWKELGISTNNPVDSTKKHVVSIEYIGLEQSLSFDSILESVQIEVDSEAAHRVILAQDYLHPKLKVINTEAMQEGFSFLLIKPIGTTLWIGPSIVPGVTGCWACLRHRLSLNRPAQMYMSERGQHALSELSFSVPTPVLHIGLNMAAIETKRWLLSDNPEEGHNTLLEFDLASMETKRHIFSRRPQCPVCSVNEYRPEPKIALNRDRVAGKEQGFRIRSFADTMDEYIHHVSPITGIVRSLKKVQGIKGDFTHNYTAGHSARLHGHTIESLRLQTRDQSGGKGMTFQQAQASALCEALERFSAIQTGHEPQHIESFHSLKENAIHPHSIMLFSTKQYDEKERWNEQQSGHFQLVPEPFDESETIPWTPAWSLTHQTVRYIPSFCCYFGYNGPESKYGKADSNGLAAGNCIEEAILHGLFELIERDAVSLWWYNRTRRSSVDLFSFNDPFLSSMINRYNELGRDLWVLDLNHDLNIPAFVALSRNRNGRAEDILMGFGAHVDSTIAVRRAVLEVNQALPTVLRDQSEREKQLLPDFADAINWWNTASLKNQPYLAPDSRKKQSKAMDYPAFDCLNLGETIEQIVVLLAQQGLETLVVNLTRPDVALNVVRVIVPGLRHFWRRLAPGRLYEVPVQTGYLDETLSEEQLNPISLFL